jgi:hypothetical protein
MVVSLYNNFKEVQMTTVDVRERTPLFKVREKVVEAAKSPGGTECPCCERHVEMYRYAFHHRLAEAMIKLVKVHERHEDWVHVHYVDPTHHLAKAVHWGLIEPKLNPETGARVAGFWRPTAKGNDFVYKEKKIASHVFLLNNKVCGKATTKTDVVKAIGSREAYEELLGAL